MKNQLYYAPDGRGLKLALPVPVGTINGRPTTLGPDGLRIVPFTDRVTAELRAANKAPQGLPLGWASCYIPGLTQVLDPNDRTAFTSGIPSNAVPGNKLYLSASGAITLTSTDTFIGYAIPLPAPMSSLGIGIASN